MKVDDVVSVMTSLGTEFVGKLISMDATMLVLKDPRLVTTNEQGMGFAAGIAMTGKPDPDQLTLNTSQIVFVTETHDTVVRAWRESTSGIITP